MKHIFTLMLSLLFIIACDDMSVTTSTGEHASSSSSTSSSSEREITLSGGSGHAFIGEDELVLKDEMVFINGKPFAKAPSGSTVRYVIKSDVKSLYVNEKSIPIGNQFLPLGGNEGAVIANLVSADVDYIDATISFNGGDIWFIDDSSHRISAKHHSLKEARKYIDSFKELAENVLNSKLVDLEVSGHGYYWWHQMLSID